MSDAPVFAPGLSAATGDEAFARAVAAAQAEITQGVERGGLRNDAYRFPLAALGSVIGVLPEFLSRVRQATHETRLPLDPASLVRLEEAATAGASKAASALVRAHNRRSVIIGSIVVAMLVLGGFGGGYWCGHRDAITRFHLAEAGFAAMMHDNPAAATGWLNLARLNDYGLVMGACHGSSEIRTPDGRHACSAPIWLDDETAAPPPAKSGKP